MRSSGFTILLALLAVLFLVPAVLQFRLGGLDAVFSPPALAVGSKIYDSFSSDAVIRIRISQAGQDAEFVLGEGGWHAKSPWDDRMDPRAAIAIVGFARGMRVEDYATLTDLDSSKLGLAERAVRIRLEDDAGRSLADFRLGRIASWRAEVDGIDDPVATVFVQPLDQGHSRHVYIATGDITPLFANGVELLRDHRPFYFNPANLKQIRIGAQQGDLTLARKDRGAPWRIIKPLELPTEPESIRRLIEGLFELRSTRVIDRADALLPGATTGSKKHKISLTSFGDDHETTLEWLPPNDPDMRTAGALVSDRPNSWFELPIKPEAGWVSIADLPLAMNDLRDPVLARIHIASLRDIEIIPSTGSVVRIKRETSGPWMTSDDGVLREANERNLFELLKAVTTTRVTSFESDAATEFGSWGLDRPVLRLIFAGGSDQRIELRFGLGLGGELFVNRLGSSSVMRLDPAFLSLIAIHQYEWQSARLWNLSRVDLTGIERQVAAESPLLLRYKFVDESWHVADAADPSKQDVMPARANYMLATLERLEVLRWLPRDHADARAALMNPSLSFKLVEKKIDDEGSLAGLSQQALRLAPGVGGDSGYYYGELDGQPHPFLIDATTYQSLAIDLLAD